MNRLEIIKQEFLSGQIDKYEYAKKIYANGHQYLFDYRQFMGGEGVISKIEIEDDSVIFTCRNSQIKLACTEGDPYWPPLTMLNFGGYESDELNMQLRLIRDGDTVFDIGGNIGWYALHIAQAYLASTIYSFEPIPWTFDLMQKNIRLNGIKNIKSNNLGLSDKAGEFEFFVDPAISGNASLTNVADKSDIQIMKCQVLTLDEYIKAQDLKVDFIKCDVEGAELFVFKGGENTIRKNLPVIFTEILRKFSAKFNYHPNQIIDFFRELGYAPYVLSGQNLKKFGLVDEDTVETNYFFLHNIKHANLIDQFCL